MRPGTTNARVQRELPKEQSEIQLQAQCFQHIWNNYPETRMCMFHVPNGGSRNAIEGMQLKASGVVAGTPDIVFIWAGRVYAFEFKTLTGTVSPAQHQVHQAWLIQGVPVKVIRTFDQWIAAVLPIINSSQTVS